ncbi:MAG: glycosyltransferase [Bacteroidales bacterium]|jgi:glycosyltransferase involved in cell wall biosynthesis|nr:glycosyltransferase [Bacteroidales bacterium]
MPKILRILNRFNLGGPMHNAAYLSKYLPEEYTTILIGGEKDDNETSSEFLLQQLNIPYTVLPAMKRRIGFINEIAAWRTIVKIIRCEKPDIVHTHAAKAGALGRLAAWWCGVPIIVHTFHGHVFHSYFGKTKTKIFIIIERLLARLSTAIVAISETQKYDLGTIHKICKPEKIHIVPLGFDLHKFTENQEEKRSNFRTHYQLNDSEIAIGIIGRLTAIKNHRLFIDAIYSCTQNTTQPIRAFIIGDGEESSSLKEYCHTLGISEQLITFTSWIHDIDRAVAGLDIICLTSFNEGTPVSLIEAQAAGKAIVSTNVGGIRDIVVENKTALLSSLDTNEFAEKLLSLIQDSAKRADMTEYARTHSVQQFSYQRLCSDMDKLYKKLGIMSCNS